MAKLVPSPPTTTVSLVAQMVKRLPTIQETRVWSLGQKVPLEKGMATHSSILAWETTCAEEPGGLQTWPSHWYTPPTAKFSPTVSRKVFQILVCSASNPARVVKQVQIESINSGIETLWLYRRLSELPECYTHLQTTEYKNTLPGSKWMMWQG